MTSCAHDLTRTIRAESGRILSALAVRCGSLDLAEDAFQEAVLAAHQQWPVKGIPLNRGAWLTTVASRRLIDRLRKEQLHENTDSIRAIEELYYSNSSELNKSQDFEIPDERLRLIFTCCHPALASNAHVPLTLKTLCGLSPKEIARAFLCTEASIHKRITRAKNKIRDAAIGFEVPSGEALEHRLGSVLSVIYLIFNESYTAFEGQSLTREDFADEAIYLCRTLLKRLPLPEVKGLLALMLLHDSRREARCAIGEGFVPLSEQNRAHWNKKKIEEGSALVMAALGEGRPGSYQIQAAISAVHALAQNWQQTDWPQIALLYQTLYEHSPSPVVALNEFVARSYFEPLKKCFSELNKLEPELENYQPFYAARSDLAERLSKLDLAEKDLCRAIELTKNVAEREFLLAKRRKLFPSETINERSH